MPAAWAVTAWHRVRLRRIPPQDAGIPVVCVGNVVVGGAGKTPVALAVAERLRVYGLVPHFLARGYRGRERGPLRVNRSRHGAADVGDEPLLLADAANTWVARDRIAGARAAARGGADVVVSDDGLQNPGLPKDVAFLVVDEGFGIGNGRVMPAGPLREPPTQAAARASAVVKMRSRSGRADLGPLVKPSVTVLTAAVEPVAEDSARLAGARVVAFAGIARPLKFFATLDALRCTVVGARAFPDHHRFRDRDIAGLIEEAEVLEARLVTTAKDAVRLPPAVRQRVEVLRVEAVFDDPEALDRVLAPALEWRRR